MAYDHKRSNKRESKNIARKMAVDSDGLNTRLVALFITIPGVPDIKEALKSGLINKKTRIIAVNHCRENHNSPYDKSIADQIKRDITKLGLKCVIVDDFLESSRGITLIKGAVKKWGKIDYMFIDLCGLATPSFCRSLNELQDLLANKSRIAMTVCTRVRQPRIINHWKKVFDGELDSPALEILSTPTSGEWIVEAFSKSSDKKTDIFAKDAVRKHIDNFLWQFQPIVASFDKFVTKVSSAIQYRDFVGMGLIVFDISRQDGGNQLFHYICETCKSAKRPLSNRVASRRFVKGGVE